MAAMTHCHCLSIVDVATCFHKNNVKPPALHGAAQDCFQPTAKGTGLNGFVVVQDRVAALETAVTAEPTFLIA